MTSQIEINMKKIKLKKNLLFEKQKQKYYSRQLICLSVYLSII